MTYLDRVVPEAMLTALAEEAPSAAPEHGTAHPRAASGSANREFRSRLLVEQWLHDRGIEFRVKQADSKGRIVYVLNACPFNASHGPDSCVMQAADGRMSAQCFHNSCAGHGWAHFKQKIGKPDRHHYDPPMGRNGPTGGAYGSRALDAPALGGTIVEVIRQYLRKKYGPTFRRGANIWAEVLGREMTRAEACAAPTSEIIPALLAAIDFPRSETGPKRSAIPGQYRQWAPIAWADLLASLDDEADSPEIADTAAEQFHGAVADALLSIESFGYHHHNGKEERVEVARRSLIDWCRLFAKPGPWQSIRSLKLWCRLDDDGRLEVVLHQGLFGQIRRGNLGPSTHRRFVQLCELYGVGTAGKTSRSRFVILAPEFLADLIETPSDVSCDGTCDAGFTRTCANGAPHVSSHPPSHVFD